MNTISICSIDRQSHPLSSPTHTHPHPDDPSSSSSPPQQSPDTDSPDGHALKQTPPLSDPPSVEPSSGAHRTLKSNAARDTLINLKASKEDRERRKRNRVTPEQLVQLETAFSKDRSPTSTERRELSNRIGMAERAVQIWFQNRSVNISQFLISTSTLNVYLSPRRAKAKHQPPRAVPPTANPPPLSGSPPASPPLGVAQEESLTNILNEREGKGCPEPSPICSHFHCRYQIFSCDRYCHWSLETDTRTAVRSRSRRLLGSSIPTSVLVYPLRWPVLSNGYSFLVGCDCQGPK